ncbi:glycosyl hydrolase 115 family protein [Chryseobacterium taeanense]|uniref:glycosyl hydrolase 115 family protein n=1 Tax=Chryseobacterium taeanense TaxID=311334 RepID=UPI0021CDBB51
MWSWSFYADDDKNSETANQMGIIMGTSHHEPMARNHQEWVRKRKEYGEWDYRTNQKNIDQFFKEGIQRAAKTEDLITIGMRGDGDTPMGGKEGEDHKTVPNDAENIKLLEKIIRNQRNIIKDVTGKPADKTPQMWALYKEVQRYYDNGLKPPDDVIILLSDDNWGNLRRLPRGKEKNHPGGRVRNLLSRRLCRCAT